ncbi:LuxE/PaaK family acyltransferase [Bergeyella sp. RCAD1439]|uniref:LuxE/PaaK family acyltransferase n=1 Tax=Bergeyella anatis TaxID=3113737 RepID=UPI003FA4087F
MEEFQKACIETFLHQYQNVEVYRHFVDFLNVRPENVSQIDQIPFLPIEIFKKHVVIDRRFQPVHYFQSSGTTNIQTRSRHYIADFSLYEESLLRSFAHFIGAPETFVFLGLLPNYSENPHSSLIYMVDALMKASAHPENGYFLYNHNELLATLERLKDQKAILFGVSFALLDFLDSVRTLTGRNLETQDRPLTIIETGGMKGRKEEITKDQLLKSLKEGFGTERIYSEYSMTELLSQAYSLEENTYQCPPWMRILIRNTEDPFAYLPDGKTGAINIIDLANRHSCAFIATQDLGKTLPETSSNPLHPRFQVLGRIDHSDIRGCSLLVS